MCLVIQLSMSLQVGGEVIDLLLCVCRSWAGVRGVPRGSVAHPRCSLLVVLFLLHDVHGRPRQFGE